MWYYKRRVDFSAYCNKFPLNARQSILCQNQVLVPIPVAFLCPAGMRECQSDAKRKGTMKRAFAKGRTTFFPSQNEKWNEVRKRWVYEQSVFVLIMNLNDAKSWEKNYAWHLITETPENFRSLLLKELRKKRNFICIYNMNNAPSRWIRFQWQRIPVNLTNFQHWYIAWFTIHSTTQAILASHRACVCLWHFYLNIY